MASLIADQQLEVIKSSTDSFLQLCVHSIRHGAGHREVLNEW